MTLIDKPLEFDLSEDQLAALPAEVRGAGRDDVRMMITSRSSGVIEHGRFSDLTLHLVEGDVLVVNTSRTLPAAVPAYSEDGRHLTVHFASPTSGGLWAIEVRSPTTTGGTSPSPPDLPPQTLYLRGGARAQLLARSPRTPRLWMAIIDGAGDLPAFLAQHGSPIRYGPGEDRPISEYQTVFAVEDGSAEMPSAGRPFTAELVTELIAHGVMVAPIVLHTGVSSYEEDESPGEERYRIPTTTAEVINTFRRRGGRVIAVGTTVVRALETVTDDFGIVHPGQGVTDLVIGPERGVHALDGLITGWHEPRSSHLRLLEAVTGNHLLRRLYREAFDSGYLWHEFGDILLILP